MNAPLRIKNNNTKVFKVSKKVKSKVKLPLLLHEFLQGTQIFSEQKSFRKGKQDDKQNGLILPAISKTQNLRKQKKFMNLFDKQIFQKKYSIIPQCKTSRLEKRSYLNNENKQGDKLMPFQRKKCESSLDYYNFILKKKSKLQNHMSKVLQNVVNQSIQPWNSSKAHEKYRNNLFVSQFQKENQNGLQDLCFLRNKLNLS